MKFALFQWTVNKQLLLRSPIRVPRCCIQLSYYRGGIKRYERMYF